MVLRCLQRAPTSMKFYTFFQQGCFLAIFFCATLSCSTAPKPQKEQREDSKQSSSIPQDKMAEWMGPYSYVGSAEMSADGKQGPIEYRLDIDKATPDSATLTIQSPGSNDSILCRLQGDFNSINIFFAGYGGSANNNKSGKGYSMGDLLFSLKKTGKKIFTDWKKLKPNAAEQNSGVYFEEK
ncbi:MAG: hypothetical protein H6623_09070 [Bdellovibrionaceae bacterium]|nr:hypothetical protein [Pseudobdellovibrionaceae bacterium]